MAGNASKYFWPHRKQELKLDWKTIILQYNIDFFILYWKVGGGLYKAPGSGVSVLPFCVLRQVWYPTVMRRVCFPPEKLKQLVT